MENSAWINNYVDSNSYLSSLSFVIQFSAFFLCNIKKGTSFAANDKTFFILSAIHSNIEELCRGNSSVL